VGVGVAAPFQMGGWHRMLGLSEAQSSAWNQIDLAAEVQAMTDLPVSFAKDTAAACVAELVGGRGRDLKSFLYLFVDTFVGGGLVINSHLHSGLHGNAGAVASLPLHGRCSVAPVRPVCAGSGGVPEGADRAPTGVVTGHRAAAQVHESASEIRLNHLQRAPQSLGIRTCH
jgi:predicted NBD/HSP70 family sugar kinase